MNAIKKIQDLVNEVTLRLTEEDKKSVSSKKRQEYVRFGLAIDNHIKNKAKRIGAVVPADMYAPYDFVLDDTVFDVKSYSSKSITVSSNEFAYAYKRAMKDLDTHYIVFKQLSNDQFVYKGTVSFIKLLKNRCFHNSQFESGGVYFDPSYVTKI